MKNYRVDVRIELFDDDTGKVVTWDSYSTYFAAPDDLHVDGGHPHYQTVDSAIDKAVHEAERR